MNPRKQSAWKSRGAANSARPSTSSGRSSTNYARSSTNSARPTTNFVKLPTIEYPDLPPFNFDKKKPGTIGTKCQIKANFASLELKSKIIYHYTITIKGRDRINNADDSKSNNLSNLRQQKRNERIVRSSNYEIFKRLIEENRDVFATEPAFDCKQNVYSSTEIPFVEGDKREFSVRIKVPEKKFPQTFDIILHRPNPYVINLGRLSDQGIKSAERELQALDIIINYGVKKFNLVLNSNSYQKYTNLLDLNKNERERINFELDSLKEGRFGHYCAAKLSEIGPQLCVDRVASVFNKGGNMLNIIQQFCFQYRNFRNRNNPTPVRIDRNFRLTRDEINELNKELKGLDFEANHLSKRPKSTIFEITQKTVGEITFSLKNRETNEEKITSVKTYFENLYEKYCEDRLKENNKELYNLPCVQVDKFRNAKYFPLEVVDICYDQYYRKKLNAEQQAIMTRICGNQTPVDRFAENENQIQNIIRCSSKCETDYLRQFGIEIRPTFNIVTGRILNYPSLFGGGNEAFKPFNAQWKPDQTSGFREKFESTSFNWVVVNFTKVDSRFYNRAPQKADVDALVKTLRNAATFNNIKLPQPAYIDYNEQINVFNQDVEDLILKAKQDANAKLMVILLPNGTEDLYHKIKFISECQQDIVTQCISHSKSRQFDKMSYCGNVILKINAKLGGINIVLHPSCKVGFLKGKHMIMGLDVTHPTRADRSQNSIASAVSTYDSKMINYNSTSVVQSAGYKEIVKLDSIVEELFGKFYNRNQFYPEKLIVYRDGVSEGQFNQVVTLEIASMKKAFEKLKCNPKVTYIICQKRHNTRFLPVNERDRLKSGNVKPGLVVDNTIVTNYNDFYLCAHFGALGTSRPTRYIVLLDESNYSGDELQTATYNLSYLFPRCLKAVSVVPPVLYAHLAAKRARSYVANLNPADRENYGDKALSNEIIDTINRKIKVNGLLEDRLYFL